MFAFLLTLLILDALLLSVVVLLQAGQGGGLASLGGATTDTVLGGQAMSVYSPRQRVDEALRLNPMSHELSQHEAEETGIAGHQRVHIGRAGGKIITQFRAHGERIAQLFERNIEFLKARAAKLANHHRQSRCCVIGKGVA